MRRFFLFILLISFFSSCSDSKKDVKVIGLTQIASHPSLDAVNQGVRDGLKDLGWVEGDNLTILFRNADRDPNLTGPIAESFVKKNVDVIIPITTPSAIAAVNATNKIPIVFVGVSDPVGVGIVQDMEKPGKNVTGSSDKWPFKKQIELFKKIQPDIQKIALLYSPGDDVSLIAVNELTQLQSEFGFELVKQPVSSPNDVYSLTRQLLRNSDAIYTGTDNLVVENLSSVLKAAFEAKKPVYGGDEGSVEKGAVATYGISNYELGYRTSKIIDAVLKGANPGEIPILTVQEGNVIINKTSLEKLGMKIPETVSVDTLITN